jgi:hypothetical protein
MTASLSGSCAHDGEPPNGTARPVEPTVGLPSHPLHPLVATRSLLTEIPETPLRLSFAPATEWPDAREIGGSNGRANGVMSTRPVQIANVRPPVRDGRSGAT